MRQLTHFQFSCIKQDFQNLYCVNWRISCSLGIKKGLMRQLTHILFLMYLEYKMRQLTHFQFLCIKKELMCQLSHFMFPVYLEIQCASIDALVAFYVSRKTMCVNWHISSFFCILKDHIHQMTYFLLLHFI